MPENEATDLGPSVDVAIPCYQYGRFLRDCVESVLSQGLRDIRVLIIDNASTDDSVEVAQQLAAADGRVEVLARRRNLGAQASFNEAIDWASSSYFMVLCADDLLAPDCLARAVSIMEREPDVGFAYGRGIFLRPHDPMPAFDARAGEAPWQIVPGEDLLERFCRDGVNHIAGPSTVVVRTVTQKLAGYYRRELPFTDDFEMWMRLASLGPVARTEAPLGILRLHGSSVTTLASRSYSGERPPALPWHDEAAFASFFAHEAGLVPHAARLHRQAKRSLVERAYWAAVAHLCRGQPAAAWELFRFAFARRPTTAVLPPLGYLFRRDRARDRIAEVVSDLMRWPRALVSHASPSERADAL